MSRGWLSRMDATATSISHMLTRIVAQNVRPLPSEPSRTDLLAPRRHRAPIATRVMPDSRHLRT